MDGAGRIIFDHPACFGSLRGFLIEQPPLSEDVFQRELHNPRLFSLRYQTEGGEGIQVRCWISEPGTVGQIECLRPEFHPLFLTYLKYSGHGHINLPEARTKDAVTLGISKSSECRLGEGQRIEI